MNINNGVGFKCFHTGATCPSLVFNLSNTWAAVSQACPQMTKNESAVYTATDS